MNIESPDRSLSEALIAHRQGAYDDADGLYRKARLAAEKNLGPDHGLVQDILERSARLYMTQGKFEKARQNLQRLRTIKEKIYGLHHPSVGRTARLLADATFAEGKHTEAESLWGLSLEIWSEYAGVDTEVKTSDMTDFDGLYGRRSRLGTVSEVNQRLTAKIRANVSDPKKVGRSLLKAHAELGAVLVTRRALTSAAQNFEYALSNLDGEAEQIWDYIWVVHQLAEIYVEQAKFGQGEELVKKYLTVLDGAYGPCHDAAAGLCSVQGLLLAGQKRYDEAGAAFRRAVACQEKLLDPEHPSLAVTYSQYAKLSLASGNVAEAEGFLRRALRIREEGLGAEHSLVANSSLELGKLLLSEGRLGEAEKLLFKGEKLIESIYGPESGRVPEALDLLSQCYIRQSRLVKAENMLSRSLAIKQLLLPTEHIDLVNAQSQLGEVYILSGKYVDAENCYRYGLNVLEKYNTDTGMAQANVCWRLAYVQGLQCKFAEADQMFRRACESILELDEDNVHYLARVMLDHADLCLKRRRYTEAERLVNKVREGVTDDNIDSRVLRARALVLSGWLAAGKGEHERCSLYLEGAVRLLEYLPPHMMPECLRIEAEISDLDLKYGSLEAAQAMIATARRQCTQQRMPESSAFACVLDSSARAFIKGGFNEAAMVDIKESLTLRERTQGPQHPDYARTLILLSKLFAASGSTSRAEENLHRALQIMEKTLGPLHTELAGALSLLANACVLRGSPDESTTLMKRAVSIWSRSPMLFDLDVFEVNVRLAQLLLDMEHRDTASALVERLLDVFPFMLGLYRGKVAESMLALAAGMIAAGDIACGVTLANRVIDCFRDVPEARVKKGDITEFIRFLSGSRENPQLKPLIVRVTGLDQGCDF